VFIEAMACGTPVIGANSGGPRDFVTDEVGVLVDETDDKEKLSASLAQAVAGALNGDWKVKRGPVCQDYAEKNFSVKTQVAKLMATLEEN
jgi:glycosyltransferase involved in cell wall biosynthesis